MTSWNFLENEKSFESEMKNIFSQFNKWSRLSLKTN